MFLEWGWHEHAISSFQHRSLRGRIGQRRHGVELDGLQTPRAEPVRQFNRKSFGLKQLSYCAVTGNCEHHTIDAFCCRHYPEGSRLRGFNCRITVFEYFVS